MALKTQGVSPKVIVTTVVSGALGIVVAVLNQVSESPDLLGGLPPLLQGLFLVILPPLATWVAGYQAKPAPVVTVSDTPRHIADDKGGFA